MWRTFEQQACRRTLAAFVVVGSVLGTAIIAEDQPADSAKAEASPLRKLFDESVHSTKLFDNEQSERPMTPRIVMRWANNTRGSEDGITLLFLSHGRPAAVCCVYPWQQQLVLDFDSLSRASFVGKQEDIAFWQPAAAGLKFHALENAEAPAESPAARLRQMKALSREFSSTLLGWKSQSEDREELRLLPRPLYRYEDLPEGDCIDGAVFAFVQGTDPETLLLLEAIKVKDRAEWQFAFGRRTSGELEGRHQGKVVWHADRFPAKQDVRSTHFVLQRPLDPEILEQLNADPKGP
ncbi:MAG TPA: hypothetical protein VHB77_13710 [Planctomycetaceae bacterium]|nr:hypothetical protein [Planctomycetaceae bacterium]